MHFLKNFSSLSLSKFRALLRVRNLGHIGVALLIAALAVFWTLYWMVYYPRISGGGVTGHYTGIVLFYVGGFCLIELRTFSCCCR
jgi:hypothetical protein